MTPSESKETRVGGGDMDTLRHPDCRYCNEYERITKGMGEQIKQLKRGSEEAGSAIADLPNWLREKADEYWSAAGEQKGRMVANYLAGHSTALMFAAAELEAALGDS